MKKLPILILAIFCGCLIATSCKEKTGIAKVVSEYKKGVIDEDSLLAYVSDSAHVKDVIMWAEKNITNDDMAKFLLGRAYKFGLGIERNPILSKVYYIEAAKDGNTNAMIGLAHLYQGYPGYENLDSAYYWYNEVAKAGNGDGFFYLSQLEIQRKALNNQPCDTAAVIKYLEQGVKLNSAPCLSYLATAYYSGFGVNVDKTKAFNMLSLAPEDKLDASGTYLLGEMYELGVGTTQNFNAAIKFYKKSAQMGNTYAMCKMGNFYQFGQGVEKNDSLAFIEYQRAANAGNPWGMRCVGSCYHNGAGVKADISNAWHWYKTAAKNGDEEAQKYCKQNGVNYSDY